MAAHSGESMIPDCDVIELSAIASEGTLPAVEAPALVLGVRECRRAADGDALILGDARGFRIALGAALPGVEVQDTEAQKR